MTRINCIPVDQLHYKHLVAEYRELPRVFALARRTLLAPREYKLGTGHVLFFYDKLAYLYHRQCQLYREMLRRGYSPAHKPETLKHWRKAKPHLWFDWVPTKEAMALNLERLDARIPNYYKLG